MAPIDYHAPPTAVCQDSPHRLMSLAPVSLDGLLASRAHLRFPRHWTV